MATTVDEIYRLLKYRANKNGWNGNVSPDDFNLIYPRAEMRYFADKYKGYQINQSNTDSILAFKTDPTTIVVDGNGKYTKPSELLHIVALRHLYNGVEVEVTEWLDDRLGNKLSSSYDAPNEEFPIYTEYKSYIQFNPKNLGSAILVSLQRITPVKYGYTLNGNGRPVYDAGASVQPQYNDTDIDAIINLALSDVAISMRDNQLENFAERKIQTEK